MDKAVTTLIDSPITPYSSAEKIRDWLDELDKMPDTPEVQEEKQRMIQLFQEVNKSN